MSAEKSLRELLRENGNGMATPTFLMFSAIVDRLEPDPKWPHEQPLQEVSYKAPAPPQRRRIDVVTADGAASWWLRRRTDHKSETLDDTWRAFLFYLKEPV